MKVAVFFGGNSCERDISIITALQTMGSMVSHTILPIIIEKNGMYTGNAMQNINTYRKLDVSKMTKLIVNDGEIYSLKSSRLKKYFKPDCALICCHGGYGENGCLQGLLEYNNIPYTSTNVLASSIGMNKIVQKRLFNEMVLNIVPYVVVYKDDFVEDISKCIKKVESKLKYPLIVKPCSQGSSIGIAMAYERKSLIEAILTASYYDIEIIVEEALTDMIEINCGAVLKGKDIIVSAIEQPTSWSEYLTFNEKYINKTKSSSELEISIDDKMQKDVKQITRKIYKKLNLNGVVRIDYMIDKNTNKLYVNELNTVPGSLANYLFEGVGIEFRELINIMLNTSIEQFKNKQNVINHFPSRVLDNYNINK